MLVLYTDQSVVGAVVHEGRCASKLLEAHTLVLEILSLGMGKIEIPSKL